MHIIFLHVLLGVPQEFMSIATKLNNPTEMISLPGHGCSNVTVDFSNVNDWLDEQLTGLKIKDFILYGYSLGGRIAMNYVCSSKTKFKPLGVIVESSNIGLAEKQDKNLRFQNELTWAKRFNNEQIKNVLSDWYNQEVFSDLSNEDKDFLIKKRINNNGKNISKVIEHLSLAKMPYLGGMLKTLNTPFLYIYGENDKKYMSIAQKICSYNNPQIKVEMLNNCGHNCHLHNSNQIATILKNFVTSISNNE